MSLETQVVETDRSATDERLIRECIRGNEEAWSALVDKYRRLIYSIPVRCGLSSDDASEVFQEVCLTLISELPKLRDPQNLPAWLIRVTASKVSRFRKSQARLLEMPIETEMEAAELPCELLQDLLREQIVRDAVSEMPPRCAALLEMLFFANPPLPYDEVAKKLSIAKGSVGFIRMRCLERLRRTLQEKGLK